MSEKNFKIASGLETGGDIFVPINADITWNIGMGTKSLTALGLSGNLQWDGYNLATEQYVTDEIGNINIPSQFITSIGTSPFLTVDNGILNFGVGNGLATNYANNTLGVKVKQGGYVGVDTDGVYVNKFDLVGGIAGLGLSSNDGTLAVDTSYVANTIAGNSLTYNGQTGEIDVNTFGIYSGASGNGIYGSEGSINVNTQYVANAIAGSGIVNNNGMLDVDTTTIATKAYADSIAAGLDIKKAVHVATSENISIGNVIYAGSQYDGHTFAEGDRVLVKDQANAYENGIYVAGLAGPSRATDADSWAELNKGSFVFVESGTHAGHGFVVTTATTGETFGQPGSSIEFTQFSDAGSFITSTANVFTVTGGNLDVNLGVTLAKSQTGPTTWGLEVDTANLAGTYLTAVGNSIEVNTTSLANQFINAGGALIAKGLKTGAIDGTLAVDAGNGLSINQISGSLEVSLSPRLEINQLDGSIDVNVSATGSALTNGQALVGYSKVQYNDNAGTLQVAKQGLDLAGSYLNYNAPFGTLDVNTSGIASVIAGNSLTYNQNTGEIDVDTFGIYSGASGNGIYGSEGSINVNTFYVANAIAGQGLVNNQGMLQVSLSPRLEINMLDGSIDINASETAGLLSGSGLTASNNKIIVNTGTNLELSVVDNKLKLVDSPTIAGTLTVTGDLVVNGSTTTLNTTTLEVEDNLIVLNKNVTGTPLANAGIEIERGNLTNASLYFDEESDQWKAHNGTSIITLGSSFISSIGQASPFLDVTAGELNLSVGNGLGTNPVDNHLQVALSAGGGLAFDAPGGTIKVDADIVGNLLEYNLIMAPDGKQKVTYVDGAGFVTDAPSLYGPKTVYHGTDANTSSGSSVINIVGRSTVNTQTWSNVGTIPVAADSFDAYITMVDANSALTRTSRVTGSIGSYTVEYTEYGIVEVGQSPILDADIMVEYDLGADAYVVKAKGQGVVVADIKYTTVA